MVRISMVGNAHPTKLPARLARSRSANSGVVMTVKVPDTAQCHNCRYLLRGLPNPICPECGQPFDPEDPESYHDPARPKRSRTRRVIRHLMPREPHSASDLSWVILLTVAVIAANASIRGVFRLQPDIGDLACCVALGFPILNVFIAALTFDLAWRWHVRTRARRERDEQVLEKFECGRRRWRVAIACIVVSWMTILYPWPACVGFYASWPSFDREARALLAGEEKRAAWRRVGLYDVENVYGPHKGIVFFQVGHSGDMRYGFAFRPDGPRPWNDRYGHHRIRWRWVLPGWYMEA